MEGLDPRKGISWARGPGGALVDEAAVETPANSEPVSADLVDGLLEAEAESAETLEETVGDHLEARGGGVALHPRPGVDDLVDGADDVLEAVALAGPRPQRPRSLRMPVSLWIWRRFRSDVLEQRF